MDYSQEYFTIESLEVNIITLIIGSSVKTSDFAWIAWSKDKTNWTTINNVDNQDIPISMSAQANEKVYWKGSGIRLANNYESSGSQYTSTFTSSNNYKVSGNIMSLLYEDSFSNKTSVSASYAFCGLFKQSAKLVDAQNLIIPITNVNQETTFCGTFNSCTGLVNPPQFSPVEVSGLRACMRMFYGCSSLLSTINFDNFITISGNNIMYDMFHNCTSLVNVPKILKPTELRQYCYGAMFQGCTSLKKAPILPAKTLANYCYYNMFKACPSLSEVTCLATDITATSCTFEWLNNVKALGTFYKDSSMTSFPSGASGIPTNWTVDTANTFTYNGHYPDNITLNGVSLSYLKVNGTQVWRRYYYTEYFTIESLEASNTITLTIGSGISAERLAWVAWSKDKTNWTTINNVDNQTVTITVNAGIEKVYWKGSGTRINVGGTIANTSRFNVTKTFNVSGNCASMWLGDNFIGVTNTDVNHIFRNTFDGCTTLISAKNLILPFTTFGTSSYNRLFNGCTNLIDAPELPSTNMTDSCYAGMFYGCTSLLKAPILPSKILSSSCYSSMFYNCTKLKDVTCLATDISASNCLTNWLSGVSASGTFYKDASMSSWPSGVSGIPTGWTIENYNA